MGLNNQNLHNVLFRGFLRPWEEYTGAKITWIDLAQADYNPRLQQAIATGTVDFDVVEMGAPFEGDVCGKGLASEMPEWVKAQIEMDDYVGYLKAPVGTWGGKTYRISIDGDCHNFNYRTDVFSDPELAAAWKAEGGQGEWGVPRTWQQVQAVTILKAAATAGPLPAISSATSRGAGSASISSAPAAPAPTQNIPTTRPAVRHRHDEAAHQQPGLGAGDPGRDRALPHEPPTRSTRSEHHRLQPVLGPKEHTPGTEFAALHLVGRIGSTQDHNDSSCLGDVCGFDILPGSDDVYNASTGQWDTLPGGPNFAPNMAYIGWGVYVMSRVDSDPVKQKAAWSAAAHLGGKDISLWMAAYPSGFQPYRNSHFNIPEWVAAGYDEAFITDYLNSELESYNHPNAAIEPRIPGIFQYYSVAEDELAKIFAGQSDAQAGADAIAAAWEKLTDQIGRDKQIDSTSSLGLCFLHASGWRQSSRRQPIS